MKTTIFTLCPGFARLLLAHRELESEKAGSRENGVQRKIFRNERSYCTENTFENNLFTWYYTGKTPLTTIPTRFTLATWGRCMLEQGSQPVKKFSKDKIVVDMLYPFSLGLFSFFFRWWSWHNTTDRFVELVELWNISGRFVKKSRSNEHVCSFFPFLDLHLTIRCLAFEYLNKMFELDVWR